MNKKWRAWAKDIFSHYDQDFDATLVFEDEKFFIMDWRDKNGFGNLATRYIVDKNKGDLIIKGDAGCCIASWYNNVKVENLVYYIDDTDYFIGKMQCSDHKYTYDRKDVEEDINEIREEMLGYIRDGGIYGEPDIDEEQCNADFDEMLEILNEWTITEGGWWPDDFEELMKKYNPDWWEGAHYGRRIDKRIYLWTYGYQEGVERLRGEEFVRKDR